MKNKIFTNEHDRLVAWTEELVKIARRAGKKVLAKRIGEECYLLPDDITVRILADEIVIIDSKPKSYAHMGVVLEKNEPVSFFPDFCGEIHLFKTFNGAVQTVINLPDGNTAIPNVEEGTNNLRIDLELERKLGKDIPEYYKEIYKKALDFYRRIEKKMPGELRESLEGKKRLANFYKKENNNLFSEMSIEELEKLKEEEEKRIAIKKEEINRRSLIHTIKKLQEESALLDLKVSKMFDDIEDEK